MGKPAFLSSLFTALFIAFTHAAVSATASPAAASEIPVEAFARLPAVRNVKLSPDGNYLAMLRSYKGTEYLSTLHIPSQKTFYITKTENEKVVFNWFRWANNDTLLMSVRYPSSRWGTKTTETRLLKSKANVDGKVQPVFRPRQQRGSIGSEHVPQFWDDIVSVLPDDPDHILLSLDLRTQNRPDVYKVNLNGGRTTVRRTRGNVVDWLADQQGRVRVGFEFDDTTHATLLYDLESQTWRKVWEYQVFGIDSVLPLGFGQDPHTLYVRAYHQDRQAIFTVDTRSQNLEKTLVFSDAKFDVDGRLIYSPKSRNVVGVSHRSKSGYVFWDKQYANFQRSLDKALPDTVNRIVGFDNTERRYVLYAEGRNKPGTYYFGDRDARSLAALLTTYPELTDKELATVKRVRYKARDGLDIEAYLTIPSHWNPDKPGPTIIHPHGGPFARDTGRFDYWTQFFANKGFAVLQPNFRGSTGYGYTFENQAVGQYGQAMQDDLVDGVQWLVDQGITDPDKVCIVGASYGGFAALVGATKTPDLFNCAISFAGVSDLRAQRDKHRNFTSNKVALEQYGKDNDALDAISPINHVKKINIPILLSHGSADRVVRVSQSRRMAKALKKHKKTFQYIELENGDHSLSNQEHRLALFKAMEQFLAEHVNP